MKTSFIQTLVPGNDIKLNDKWTLEVHSWSCITGFCAYMCNTENGAMFQINTKNCAKWMENILNQNEETAKRNLIKKFESLTK